MSNRSTLLLRLEGPLQSWGYRSRFKIRDTGLEPSKSGVIGLLCCALGRDRSESPEDLAALKMHVRIDRPGRVMTDFHTAGGGTFRGRSDYYAPTSSGSKGKNPIITEKQYLADASFAVALEGDQALISELAIAVQDPVWPLNLGRKSCSPSVAVYVGQSSDEAVLAFASIRPPDPKADRPHYLWEMEHPDSTTETRNDVPIAWNDRLNRRYTVRFIKSEIGEWAE